MLGVMSTTDDGATTAMPRDRGDDKLAANGYRCKLRGFGYCDLRWWFRVCRYIAALVWVVLKFNTLSVCNRIATMPQGTP